MPTYIHTCTCILIIVTMLHTCAPSIDNGCHSASHCVLALILSIMQSLVSLAAACIVVLQCKMYIIGAYTAKARSILMKICPH